MNKESHDVTVSSFGSFFFAYFNVIFGFMVKYYLLLSLRVWVFAPNSKHFELKNKFSFFLTMNQSYQLYLIPRLSSIYGFSFFLIFIFPKMCKRAKLKMLSLSSSWMNCFLRTKNFHLRTLKEEKEYISHIFRLNKQIKRIKITHGKLCWKQIYITWLTIVKRANSFLEMNFFAALNVSLCTEGSSPFIYCFRSCLSSMWCYFSS